MTLNFGQLLAFTGILLAFALVVIVPFIGYLLFRDKRERNAEHWRRDYSKSRGDSQKNQSGTLSPEVPYTT
jgi:hypothetical protein